MNRPRHNRVIKFKQTIFFRLKDIKRYKAEVANNSLQINTQKSK